MTNLEKYKLKYLQRYISHCLKQIGYSIAASNAAECEDIKLLKLYAEQVDKNNKYWPVSQREFYKNFLDRNFN